MAVGANEGHQACPDPTHEHAASLVRGSGSESLCHNTLPNRMLYGQLACTYGQVAPHTCVLPACEHCPQVENATAALRTAVQGDATLMDAHRMLAKVPRTLTDWARKGCPKCMRDSGSQNIQRACVRYMLVEAISNWQTRHWRNC